MGNSLWFEGESRILELSLDKPQPNKRRGTKLQSPGFVLRVGIFLIYRQQRYNKAWRGNTPGFVTALQESLKQIYARTAPDGSFLRLHPRNLGQLQKLNVCRRKHSARTAKELPLPSPPASFPRDGRATGRIWGGGSSCPSPRSPQLPATAAGGGSSPVGRAGSIPRRGHAECAASGLQRAGGRPRAGPGLYPRLRISNFAALGTFSGDRRESASHRVGHVCGGHPHARPLSPLLPPPRTSPRRGIPCPGTPRVQPAHLPTPDRAGRVALSRRRTCRTRRAPPWWPGCWSWAR